jgi:hypothetical protein
MRKFTTILAGSSPLPQQLALLEAPVVLAENDVERVGTIRGVVIDDRRRVVFFVVEPSLDGAMSTGKILVPLDALEFGGSISTEGEPGLGWTGPIVRLLWSRDQLRAQPHMPDDAHLPPDPSGTPVPPDTGANRPEAIKNAFRGTGIGAALGLAIGLAAGGPVTAAALGIFFALGGGVAGAIGGAGRSSAADAAHHMPPIVDSPAGLWHVRELQRTLRDRSLYESGLLVRKIMLEDRPTWPAPRVFTHEGRDRSAGPGGTR